MLSFENDYSEGAHEKILRRLLETNMDQEPGYGEDRFSESARDKIRKECGCEDADVFFLTGGTQTNKTVIASVLRPWEGVVAADTGHIAAHEAGAVEYTGHKVLTVPGEEGKIRADVLADFLRTFYEDENHSHMVYPGMVYISHPTEYGTLYTKGELAELSGICAEYGIPLYLDGARLGYGLAAPGTDVTLRDVAEYCDVFYIGGTKVGALCGEAVVFPKGNTPLHFMTMVKQHGALLAKGRLNGLQFDVLFTDGLYMEISRHAVQMAGILKQTLRKKGYTFYLESPTNQIFVLLENEKLKEIQKHVRVSFWEKADESHTVVRFATSWATRPEDVDRLAELL